MPEQPEIIHLAALDLVIIALYMVACAAIGFWVHKLATKDLAAYFLGERGIRWWMLGLSGCSSYIDIGGTMAMVGLMYYVGLKSVWLTHVFWGWFIICFYMAFQAKYIRRSGVMTFAEWNVTRFGPGRDVEQARISSGVFLLVLMVFNLIFIAVGIGKFAEHFLPWPRWISTLLVYAVVGLYTTMGGFFGVIIADVFQTVLIAIGAFVLAVMAFQQGDPSALVTGRGGADWASLAPTWTLWEGYTRNTLASYQHFYAFGPVLLAGFSWVVFRILAGPNVWDFQFFLTTRDSREASLAAGTWTVSYILRWILGAAFLLLALHSLQGQIVEVDAERIMPLVLGKLRVGMRGVFIAVLLAALMSTLDAMINVTSSVVVNDFVKRYFAQTFSEKRLVRVGQIASVAALLLGFAFSLGILDVISAWEVMILDVVTVILVPATLRWHWWRFNPKGFTWGMIATAGVIVLQKIFYPGAPVYVWLPANVAASILVTVIVCLQTAPPDREVLVQFYSRVRPFGFWGPVRREAEKRGLVPERDPMPSLDAVNGLLTAVFQFGLALVPFYGLLRMWREAVIWGAVVAGLGVALYFT